MTDLKNIHATDIRNEFERTFNDRLERLLQLDRIGIVPNGHFAIPSVECMHLYRDGHFFGCIALTQSVAEAIVRFVWQTKRKKKSSQAPNLEKTIADLSKGSFITGIIKDKIEEIWLKRNDYRHLNPSVELDIQKLQELACRNLQLLAEIEQEFFGYTIENGQVLFKDKDFWDINDQGLALVYVRPSS